MSFKSIVQGILKPFARAGEQASIIGATFGSAKDPAKYRALRNYKPRFLTEEETINQLENPALTSIKTGVGIGSFLTPGATVGAGATTGARIANAAKLGAIGGAASSFGSSDTQGMDLIADVAKGGVTGAILGGGLTAGTIGLSKMLGKTPTTSAGFRAKNLGIKTPKTPTGYIDKLALETDVLNIMDEFNLPVNSKRQAAKSMSEAYTKLADELQAAVSSKGGARMGKNNIFDDAFNRASMEVDDVTKGAAGKAMEVYKNKLMKDSVYFSPKEALDFKFDLQKEMGPIYKKIKAGNPLAPKEAITKSFHDSVDDVLKATVPEAEVALAKMSKLHSAAPDIITAANKGTSMKVSPLGIELGSIDTTRVTDFLASLGSNIKTGAGNVGSKFGSTLSRVPTQQLSGILGVLSGAGSTGGETTGDTTGQDIQEMQDTQAPVDVEREKAMITLDLMSKGMKFTQAKAYADMIALVKFGSTEGGLSPTQKNALNAVDQLESAFKGLDIGVDSNVGISGGLEVLGNKIRSKTDQEYASNLKKYTSLASYLTGILNQARGAGTLNEGEYQVMLANMPGATSTPEEAQYYFNQLRGFLRGSKAQPQSAVSDASALEALGL